MHTSWNLWSQGSTITGAEFRRSKQIEQSITYLVWSIEYPMSLRKHHSGMMVALKSLGRTDQWSRYMTGGGYTDAIQVGNYKVEFQEDDHDIRMLVWNQTRPCITMVVDKHDTIAVIDSIEYSPGCTVDGRMKRGEGTRDMIRFALRLLKAKGATKVQLTDMSSVVCDGVKVRLGLMSLFRSGQTWYEKHFGFRPEAKYAERYARAKASLQLVDKPCSYFTDDVLDDLVAKSGLVFFNRIVWELDFSTNRP